MAALLAQDPPHQSFSFSHPDVVRFSAMAMFPLDAVASDQPTDVESVARSLSIQPRVPTPPRPASVSQFAVPSRYP